ncbi:energy transducer TonB [Candidatus Auribacterota bacterium]
MNKELIISAALSFLIHLALILGNLSFNSTQTPLRLDFKQAPFSMELSLVPKVSPVPEKLIKKEVFKEPNQEKIMIKKEVKKKIKEKIQKKEIKQKEINPKKKSHPLQTRQGIRKAQALTNTPPLYPLLARNRGYEGKVELKILVDVYGKAKKVAIYKSSGYKILDKAALKSVRKWQFIPAKKNHLPMESTLIIPIVFKLEE